MNLADVSWFDAAELALLALARNVYALLWRAGVLETEQSRDRRI